MNRGFLGEMIPGLNTLTNLLRGTSSSSTINAQSGLVDDMQDIEDDVTNVLLGSDEVLGPDTDTGVSKMSSGVGHTGLWNDDIVGFIKDEISKIEKDGNVVVAFFGENVLNYNIGLGASGIYEMLIFFDNASYPVELTSGVYKSVMLDMIDGFLQGLTTQMNHGLDVDHKYVLSRAPDSVKEEKFHYFTSSFVFEIRDGDGNVVFYCEFGRIQDIDKFKSFFTYSRDNPVYVPQHPLLPYYLNDDGFLFTFFLTMKTMKIKKGIAHFEKCIQKIKDFRFDNVGRKRERAFQDKLIHLFTVQFSEMFRLSMIVPVVPASGKTMYLPLYEIMQTEILQEIFIIFDANVSGVGRDMLSYREFAMQLNQHLLKAVGGVDSIFGNTSKVVGPLMSIYQLLVYYTNALNDAFSSHGCLAQESGGDVSKKYTWGADVNGAPYLSDVDIKFFFPSSRGFDEYEFRIINSLFYLIAFLEEHQYLRYPDHFVGTVHFGSHIFNFFIDSKSQKRIFGIRYAKGWNGLAGLLSADIKLNIVFQHHKNDGTITGYKGKFVMAFFDVACWEKGVSDISKYQYSTKISDLKGRELGFGGPVDLMNIPSLGASLKESNELVYDQKGEREKVNKHEKDKVRRVEYLRLAKMVIKDNLDCLVDKPRLSLDDIDTEIDNVGEISSPLFNYDWTKLDCLKDIDKLPLKQLQTICAIEQVAYDGVDRDRFESNKMHFITKIREIFEISKPIRQTGIFLSLLENNNNKAKTSYREKLETREILRSVAAGGLRGGSGSRRRRKRRGVTKKQKRRLGRTRRR